MQPLNYHYSAMILMGVIFVALVATFLRPLNCWWLLRLIRAPRSSPLTTTFVVFAALLASLAFASTSHAEALDTTASDKALYAHVSRYPLHRGYMYCLVAIEYSGDYQGRFCPGNRLLIGRAQKALNQPILDLHDDAELRRILLAISRFAKEGRDAQPEQGAQTPVASSSRDQITKYYKKEPAEQPFLYCYADILYFADVGSAYCRYTIAKFNLLLFEESEPLLPDHDPAVLFSMLKSILLREKP
ncbi:hypothetical protein RCCGEPOP_16058 [Rhizobium sp. Pop5]|nr:hypothetical protein RCCGEPOP_16058 [Rhizobium sp. Pop5]